jgi:ribosomal-protein-alanine N-acetyltransferase
MVTLRTARLILRPARADDLAAFFGIMSNARAMAHWSTLPHASPAVTRDWMGLMLEQGEDGHDLVIERNGTVIGKAGGCRLPEIGFILHPDYWSQGYATEAMTALVPHIFATSDLPALTADVDPDNLASRAVLRKLGFVETHRAERTFCLGGVWADSIYLELARPPFLA